uniref:Uncharacterized protein n=1 Tax=Anguilla anguilla TaxID=7936 RepID=A0A0E9SBJ3_ANGAN
MMVREQWSHLKMVLVLAKLRMGPRTTSIPLVVRCVQLLK